MLDLGVSTNSPGLQLEKGWVIAGAMATAFSAVIVLNFPESQFSVAVGMIGAGVLLCFGWLLVKREPMRLAFVLMLLELLGNCFFLSDTVRPLFSYGLTALFCTPVTTILWKAWRTRNSGFRLYLIYFLFCLLSVVYSLVPTYSAARLIRSVLLFAGVATCCVRVRDEEGVEIIIRNLLSACIIVTLMTTLAAIILPRSLTWPPPVDQFGQLIINPDEPVIPRFVGIFMGPNQVGELMLITVGLIFAYWQFATSTEKILLAPVALLAVGLAGLADSRSPIASLGIGCTLYAVWKYGSRGLLISAASAVFCLGRTDLGRRGFDYLYLARRCIDPDRACGNVAVRIEPDRG